MLGAARLCLRALEVKNGQLWTKEDAKKPLAIVGESNIAVLLELVARVSLNPKVCSENGVANLKSLPADLHLVRRSIQILVITALDLSPHVLLSFCIHTLLIHLAICVTAADTRSTFDMISDYSSRRRCSFGVRSLVGQIKETCG